MFINLVTVSLQVPGYGLFPGMLTDPKFTEGHIRVVGSGGCMNLKRDGTVEENVTDRPGCKSPGTSVTNLSTDLTKSYGNLGEGEVVTDPFSKCSRVPRVTNGYSLKSSEINTRLLLLRKSLDDGGKVETGYQSVH